MQVAFAEFYDELRGEELYLEYEIELIVED